MNRKTISLKKLTLSLFKNDSKGMTGRSCGTKIREFIEKILQREKSFLLVLDFSGVGSVDFSWADEVVAKIISRLWGGEYGEKFLVLKNLNSSQIENIHVALERKRLATFAIGPGGWQIIGSLNNYLAHTLDQVMKKRRLTMKQLSKEEGIGQNTSGTRLLNLYKKRLVMRVEGPTERKGDLHRGKQYVYQPLFP